MRKDNDIIIWRALAVTGFTLMLITQCFKIITLRNMEHIFVFLEDGVLSVFTVFLTNIIASSAFLYLIFRPLSFRIYFFFSLYYTIINIVDGGNYPMFFFLLTCASAYRSGFLQRNMKKRLIIGLICYLLIYLTQIRLGFSFFFNSILNIIALLLILAVTALLLSEEIKKFISLNSPDILILNKYPDLTDRDKSFLKSVFTGEKFAYIASKNGVSPGTVKNRMRDIYKILGVADKTEMLIRYSGCKEHYSHSE